jgi:hypothetical protein
MCSMRQRFDLVRAVAARRHSWRGLREGECAEYLPPMAARRAATIDECDTHAWLNAEL